MEASRPGDRGSHAELAASVLIQHSKPSLAPKGRRRGSLCS